MMRILLAVSDSAAGLAAAHAAVDLARRAAGQLRALHALPEPAGAGRGRSTEARSERSASTRGGTVPVLDYVAKLARGAGIALDVVTPSGRPARCILDQAASWHPDVIVIGRSGVHHVGQPFVGSQVVQVLEFADVPVLVVPATLRIGHG